MITNVWGLWFFFYIPAFVIGGLVGGTFVAMLAKKTIRQERARANRYAARQTVQEELPRIRPVDLRLSA